MMLPFFPNFTWGAFHFWGHAEFYVTIPLKQNSLSNNSETDFQLLHSVATGARFYPWTMKEKKIRPYGGLHWGALDFRQIIPDENQPTISKDFLLNFELGLSFNYKKIGGRIGVNYFPNTKWNYPISKTEKAEIKTPAYSLQFGLLYTFDATKNGKNKRVDDWNSYPKNSKLSYDSKRFGDFFIGIGPSISFSLIRSEYNVDQFPYLKEKLTSNSYFDLAVGYQFNKADLFTAISFRNSTFETEGYGAKQTIKKNSLTLEVNKFLIDYTGFAPYLGLTVAYDKLNYIQTIDGIEKKLTVSSIEPGITFGWDIVPGKTNEALILRTNLRWYPFSKFEVEGKNFNFSQLEYNLIQIVFYPNRLRKR